MGIFQIIFFIIVIYIILSSTGFGKKGKNTKKLQNNKKHLRNDEFDFSKFTPNKGQSVKSYQNDRTYQTQGYVRDDKYLGLNADFNNVDSISETVTKCGYCGANNIVPIHKVHSYSCYFCRERL